MKTVLNKFAVELRVTALDGKPSEKEGSVKETAKSLTTLEVIGLVVLTMFPLALFHDMRIGLDNRKEND